MKKMMMIFMAGLLLISLNVFADEPGTGTPGSSTPAPGPPPGSTHNTAYGDNALSLNTTGNHNTAIGKLSLYHNTTGNYNTSNGDSALSSNTTGSNNTANGAYALRSNTTANKNTAIGHSALRTQSYNNGGTSWDSHNTAVGFEALYENQPTSTTYGHLNTAVGSLAMRYNTTGSDNVAIGYNALHYNTTGKRNTAIGWRALSSITGENNIAIGADATVLGNHRNSIAIGDGAIADESNKVVIGNTHTAKIGGYVSWSDWSDQRVKTDVQDLGYGLDLIRQLRPVTFKKINGNGNTDFGFIAQDVEALLGDGYNVLDIGGGEERMLSLRYAQFIAPMVKAMQEQQVQIEEQQRQIDELKTIVAGLRKRL